MNPGGYVFVKYAMCRKKTSTTAFWGANYGSWLVIHPKAPHMPGGLENADSRAVLALQTQFIYLVEASMQQERD